MTVGKKGGWGGGYSETLEKLEITQSTLYKKTQGVT